MRKYFILMPMIALSIMSYSQCIENDGNIKKIIDDFITNSINKATIYTITITKEKDTVYYKISSIATVLELNEFKISDYQILKNCYFLFSDTRCSTMKPIKEDKRLYGILKKHCFDDETTAIDENGDEHVTLMIYDPSAFMWKEVNGELISKVILNP